MRPTRAGGRELLVIDTGRPWGVEASCGGTRFAVFPGQLAEVE